MARSNKARYGQKCALWKDTVLASRSQKRAWSKTKQRRNQAERTRAKQELKVDGE